MPKKINKKQLLQQKQKQLQKQRQKQLQLQKQKQLQKQLQRQRQIQIQRKKQMNRRKALCKKRAKQHNNCVRECQCQFRREEDYGFNQSYYRHSNCNNNCNSNCNPHDGINLPPGDVCVPSRNYQFFQLPHFPNAPINDIPDFGYGGGGFGSGLGHDMRLPYISPHSGMDMFTGTLDAPMAPNPMYLSYPLF